MDWIGVGILIGVGLMLAPVIVGLVVFLLDFLFFVLAWAIVGACYLVPLLIIPLFVFSPLFPDPSLPQAVAFMFTLLTLSGWLVSKFENFKEKRRQAREAHLYQPKPVSFTDHGRGPLTPGELSGEAWRR